MKRDLHPSSRTLSSRVSARPLSGVTLALLLATALAGLPAALSADVVGSSTRTCQRHHRPARLSAVEAVASWDLFTLAALSPRQAPECVMTPTGVEPMPLQSIELNFDARPTDEVAAGLLNLPPPMSV